MMFKWIIVFVFVTVSVASDPEEESSNPDVFEGDMILSPEQRAAAMSGGDVDAPVGRGAIKNKRWPGGVVVYQIDGALARNSRAMNAIRSGMNEWTSKTCIRFKQRTNERGYAYFKIGSGCSSHVGRLGWRQDINLASGCWHTGIVAHEIGHALGFYHEQSRPDRDQYVTIHWENIIGNAKFNFNKYNRNTIDSLGTPYDYDSVMHYGSRAFSRNGRPTISPRRGGVSIGQRRGLSRIDAQQMNLLYRGVCSGGGGGGGSVVGPPQPPPPSCNDKNPLCGVMGFLCFLPNIQNDCRKTCNKC